MKTKLSLPQIFVIVLFLTLSPAPSALGQVPQGFNYQAIARDAVSGNPITETVSVKIAILAADASTIVYEEEHSSVDPDEHGLFSLVVGQGTWVAGVAQFSDIDWTETPKYIRTSVYYGGNWKVLDPAQLWSVPYAMVADSLGGPLTKLEVEGETEDMEESLFEVRNKDGHIVFAVYNEGVRIYVSDGDIKGPKGGFAIGGFGLVKQEDNHQYFFVSGDSIRAYIDSTSVKGPKGGFAIGGFDYDKGKSQDYMKVTRDSVRIYLDANPATKGPKGGFAIGGFDYTKGDQNFFNVSMDTLGKVYPSENRILWYPLKNAFRTGKVLIEKRDSVGENSFASGFESKAIGKYSQSLGYQAIARGDYSTAIGNQAQATAINSFALGEMAMALGVESYALGREAKATGNRSFAFGSAAPAGSGGGYSWNEAGAPEASGDYSFAIGNGTKAQGKSSVAIGFKSVASNYFAVAMGYQNTASGWASTAMGYETIASGDYGSTAMGFSTISSGGYGSTAMGENTRASEWASTAMGYGTEACGYASTAMGCETIASEQGSTAMGEYTKASGGASTAMGRQTTASGWNSTAMGSSIIVAGNCSFGIGLQYKDEEEQGEIPYSITANNTMAIMGGKVGIDTVSPSKTLYVNGTAGGTHQWEQDSDKRLKTNIIPLEGALQSVLKLQGVTFNWINETNHRPGQNIGLIAQEVKEILPEIVSGGGKDEQGNEIYYSIEYATLTPVLVEAIKEQEKKIESQQQQIDELKAMVEELKIR